MHIVQTLNAGTPNPEWAGKVTLTNTPKTLFTLLSITAFDVNKKPKYALVYVLEGIMQISSLSDCDAGEGIAVERGQLVKLTGFNEITQFYFRTFIEDAADVELYVEMEY